MSARYLEIPPSIRPAVGQRALWRVEDRTIALFNVGGTLHAIDDSCPHAGASLLGGVLDGRVVRCRAHGLRFDLATGGMPGARGFGVRAYAIEMRGDTAWLALDELSDREQACEASPAC